jgi:tRNA dimethylallyltransferase
MSNKSGNSLILVIAGPTASGKSALALEKAQALDGVIINADSMQIYKELPILTAQPDEQDKQKTQHLLYGALHPDDPCSAGRWREMAGEAIEDVLKSGRTPIIVGGTGLYIKALLEGLSGIPPVPAEIREAASRKQEELGNPGFYEELKKRDPVMAARFHPNHTARLIRAWEVLEATGRSLAEWQKESRLAPPDHWHFEIHKIMPEREELIRRCDERFLKMLENGVLEEVKNYSAKIGAGEIKQDVLLNKALGLRPLRDYLETGLPLVEATARAQAETRRYAKRQVTWFRHQL